MTGLPGLLGHSFFLYASLAAVLVSIICGFLGTYIVARRIVFISGGITHSSFGGIGIAHFAGINPLMGALAFSLISAFGIHTLSRKAMLREDSAIAFLWSFGMATGLLFIFLTPGYSPNLMGYLFGTILTVNESDLLLMLIMAVVSVAFFTVYYRLILYVSFDEEFARSRGIPVSMINLILLALVAVTIVLSIKAVGVILVISLLTIPQSSAGLFARTFSGMIYLSVINGLAGSLGGLYLSYYLNLPSGASIIMLLVVLFGLQWIIRRTFSFQRLSNKGNL
ncbi:MAG: metal ABC transporter permease [Bacteroidales bacterium]|nr:metal ABC transporter permease [Bacteroidales bacterium]